MPNELEPLNFDALGYSLDELYQTARNAIESLPSGDAYDETYRAGLRAIVGMYHQLQILREGSRATIDTLTEQRNAAINEVSRLEDDLENPERYFTASLRDQMDERVRDAYHRLLADAQEDTYDDALVYAYNDVTNNIKERLAQVLGISPETAYEIIALITDED